MKTIIINIWKILQGGLILTAAVALIVGGVFCCCLTKSAHASTVKKGCCHKAEKSTPSKICDHCQIKSIDSDHLVQSFNLVPEFAKFINSFSAFDALVYQIQARCSTRLTSTSPPRAAALPIYLQLSNLRL